MKGWLKYLAFMVISAKSNLAYFGEVVSRAAFLAIILFILLKLWQATYAQQGQALLGGLAITQMLWYLMITEATAISEPRVSQQTDEDIRTGALTVQLVRPMSYLLVRLSSSFGERMVSFLTTVILGSLVVFFLIGKAQLSPVAFLMLLLAVPLAFVIDFLGSFLIGLGAFWIENTSGLSQIYSRLNWILGGMLLPLDLFPKWCQGVLSFLPFSQVMYGPAMIFASPDWSNLFMLLARQSLSIAVMSAIVWLVYNRALARVFSNGG